MNVQYKRSLYTMVLFSVLFVFIMIDFAILGPHRFLNRPNTIITAAVVLTVMVGFFSMLYVTKTTEMVIDERDRNIQQKASMTALTLTTIYVFLFCISLYISYETVGTLPVSWMWFLAYSTYAFTFFSTSFVSVILYHKK